MYLSFFAYILQFGPFWSLTFGLFAPGLFGQFGKWAFLDRAFLVWAFLVLGLFHPIPVKGVNINSQTGLLSNKPIPRRQILDSSKLKEFADDDSKFDENGRKLLKQVENTVGKGEIACYEQFLLFPQCFQKACFPGASEGVIVWE